MRIALLYPPPWKIAAPGEPPPPDGEGPPAEYAEGDLDGDFFQTPYGLFALGAQALRVGHSVKVINLSGFAWTKVQDVLRALVADVYGRRAGRRIGGVWRWSRARSSAYSRPPTSS